MLGQSDNSGHLKENEEQAVKSRQHWPITYTHYMHCDSQQSIARCVYDREAGCNTSAVRKKSSMLIFAKHLSNTNQDSQWTHVVLL